MFTSSTVVLINTEVSIRANSPDSSSNCSEMNGDCVQSISAVIMIRLIFLSLMAREELGCLIVPSLFLSNGI